ncbi:twin-arginine translocase subunit TatC [Stomatohabitans albus]|uniref:twin-arginine translocase subunit TatC n=1 Tax=Stomatohabitans albus TaxID=3110766 RepID=UPI00300D63C0
MSPFGHHLDELRWRAGLVGLVLVVLMGLGLLISDSWLDVLTRPLCSVAQGKGDQSPFVLERCQLLGTSVFSGLYFQVVGAGLFAGMFGVPLSIWQGILFCKPMVTSHQYRRCCRYGVVAVLVWGITLSLSWWLIGPILSVVGSFGSPWVFVMVSPSAYVAFLLSLSISLFSLASLPGCVAVLLDLGMITGDQILNYRKQRVLGVLVISAVITPTQDPITMVVLAVPIIAVIELLGWWAQHRGHLD